AVRRESEFADPLRVGLDGANLLVLLDVPPDQLAVVAAGDERAARQRQAGDVAGVAREFLVLRLWGGEVGLVDLEVGAAGEDAAAVRDARDAQEDARPRHVLGELELFEIDGHESLAGILTRRASEGSRPSLARRVGVSGYASTSFTGLMPGSVSGTGRAPT